MMALLLCTGTRHATIADHGQVVWRAVIDLTGPADLRDGGDKHEIYIGDAAGVDLIVRQIFRPPGWTVREFEASWEECGPGCPDREHRRRYRGGGDYCPYAGPRRNRAMVRAFIAAGGKDVLGFPAANTASRGTRGCMRDARRAGLIVAPAVALTVQVRRHA